MTENENTDAIDELSEITLQIIGRFFITFSLLEDALHWSLCVTLEIDEEKYPNVFGLLRFAELITTWKIVLSIFFKEDISTLDEINSICKDAHKLNSEYRNPIAHAKWVEDADGMRAEHLSRTSLARKVEFEDPNDLMKGLYLATELSSRVTEVARKVLRKLGKIIE